MKSFDVVKDLKDNLKNKGFDCDLVPIGTLPKKNQTIKLMYQVISNNFGWGSDERNEEETVQLTVVGVKNSYSEQKKLSSVVNVVWDYLLQCKFSDMRVIPDFGPIKIIYLADEFLPAKVINFKVKYRVETVAL